VLVVALRGLGVGGEVLQRELADGATLAGGGASSSVPVVRRTARHWRVALRAIGGLGGRQGAASRQRLERLLAIESGGELVGAWRRQGTAGACREEGSRDD
jgi:hypothetical protein